MTGDVIPPVPPMAFPSILHAFLSHVARAPDAPCVLFEGRSISYGQLAAAAAGWAVRLQDEGVQPGDRVALFLENSPVFLAAYLGAHMAAGIVVLVNTAYRQSELRHILNDSGARLCISDAAGVRELERVRAELPGLHQVWTVDDAAWMLSPDAPPVPSLPSIAQVQADTIALLAYTSGTTGRAKGAMLSHGNLAANSAAVTAAWRWSAADTLLLALPLFHIHGLGVGVNGTLLSGARVDLRRRFDAAEVYAALAGDAATMFFGVPTMYTRLIAEARQRTANQTDNAAQKAGSQVSVPGARVRLFVSGSAPLSPQTFAEFEELFGGRILERYGMTETVMNLTNPYDGERRPGTVGMPFPGQEARIVDVRTRQPLADGETGEIQVRGPNVFKGYWQRPDATADAFNAEGWFNTGDLGRRSADGYYTISGRAKELIITGGYNVYPREVEEVLLAHPAVAEAAVFGLPDPDLGEQVVAAIVPIADYRLQLAHTDDAQRQSTSDKLQATLVDLCREQLASYKKPRQIFFVDTLPRNALGKVQKHLLQEQVGGSNTIDDRPSWRATGFRPTPNW